MANQYTSNSYKSLVLLSLVCLLFITSPANAKSRSQQGHQESICPGNQVAAPTEDTGYKFRANGCGPEGMQVKESFGLYKCCNQHDICYGICGTSFDFCEKTFSKCMKQVCGGQNGGREVKQQCGDQAQSFSSMTRMFGKAMHQGGQREACQCYSDQTTADTRHRGYLRELFMRYDNAKATEENLESVLKKYSGKEGEAYFTIIKKYGAKDVQFTNIKEEL